MKKIILLPLLFIIFYAQAEPMPQTESVQVKLIRKKQGSSLLALEERYIYTISNITPQ